MKLLQTLISIGAEDLPACHTGAEFLLWLTDMEEEVRAIVCHSPTRAHRAPCTEGVGCLADEVLSQVCLLGGKLGAPRDQRGSFSKAQKKGREWRRGKEYISPTFQKKLNWYPEYKKSSKSKSPLIVKNQFRKL